MYVVSEETTENISRGPPVTVMLVKDGAGLGFSLEGGKDSPFGDQPLTIKKIFTGELTTFLELMTKIIMYFMNV